MEEYTYNELWKYVHTTKYGFDWLSWGLMTRQPLWVILCRLSEKETREIEEIVEKMKERNRGEGKMTDREETEEIKGFPL